VRSSATRSEARTPLKGINEKGTGMRRFQELIHAVFHGLEDIFIALPELIFVRDLQNNGPSHAEACCQKRAVALKRSYTLVDGSDEVGGAVEHLLQKPPRLGFDFWMVLTERRTRAHGLVQHAPDNAKPRKVRCECLLPPDTLAGHHEYE
jgi:hypothetical protein